MESWYNFHMNKHVDVSSVNSFKQISCLNYNIDLCVCTVQSCTSSKSDDILDRIVSSMLSVKAVNAIISSTASIMFFVLPLQYICKWSCLGTCVCIAYPSPGNNLQLFALSKAAAIL